MDIRPINLSDIVDGEMVAVIVREPGSDGYHIAGYCDGNAVPDSVESAVSGETVKAACVCGKGDLMYQGFSHQMPAIHPWPTLTYRCTACGRTLSFMRLTAADARRAMSGGLGTAPDGA